MVILIHPLIYRTPPPPQGPHTPANNSANYVKKYLKRSACAKQFSYKPIKNWHCNSAQNLANTDHESFTAQQKNYLQRVPLWTLGGTTLIKSLKTRSSPLPLWTFFLTNVYDFTGLQQSKILQTEETHMSILTL